MNIENCYINADDQTLILTLSDKNTLVIKIDGDINNDQELSLISEANRRHLIANRNNCRFKNGCLPAACLGLNTKENGSFNVNSRYLINFFIHLMKLLANKNDPNNNNIDITFGRDGDVYIPTSNSNMNDLLNKVFHEIENYKSNNNDDDNNNNNVLFAVDNNNNNNQHHPGLNPMIHIFNTCLQQFLNIEKKLEAKNNKVVNKLQKHQGRAPGIPTLKSLIDNVNNNGNCQFSNKFIKALDECSQMMESCIELHKDDILKIVLNPDNSEMIGMKQFLELMNAKQPPLPIYHNQVIDFKLMFVCIGEVINAAFLNIIPQKSMIEAVMACMYHTSFLEEMNMLNRFANLTYLPIIYRFIRCCFKIPENENEYVKSSQLLGPGIIKEIKSLNNANNSVDDNITHLCKIGLKMEDASDAIYISALYYAFNEIRGSSHEIYIIFLITILAKGYYAEMNKNNKILNTKNIITPLYHMIDAFYKHVIQQDIQHAMSIFTLDSFYNTNQAEILKNVSLLVSSVNAM